MIVRRQGDQLTLISQSDHARLSGLFAAHWGNAQFKRPAPLESVVRAAAFHDCGWYDYDTRPIYEAGTGETPSFVRVPFDAAQVRAHEGGIAWLAGIDPYAGLMMSRHRTGLLRGRYDTVRHPAPPPRRELGEAAAAFLVRAEAAQLDAMAAIDEVAFGLNFHLLQVWDLLSLYLCSAEPKAERIEPVPTGDAAAAVTLTLVPLDTEQVTIDPYPFAADQLSVSYVYRVLDATSFSDEASFRIAWFGAAPQVRRFTFARDGKRSD